MTSALGLKQILYLWSGSIREGSKNSSYGLQVDEVVNVIYDFRLGSKVRTGKPSTSSSVVSFGRDEGAEEQASKTEMGWLESVSVHWMTSDELMGQSASTGDLLG